MTRARRFAGVWAAVVVVLAIAPGTAGAQSDDEEREPVVELLDSPDLPAWVVDGGGILFGIRLAAPDRVDVEIRGPLSSPAELEAAIEPDGDGEGEIGAVEFTTTVLGFEGIEGAPNEARTFVRLPIGAPPAGDQLPDGVTPADEDRVELPAPGVYVLDIAVRYENGTVSEPFRRPFVYAGSLDAAPRLQLLATLSAPVRVTDGAPRLTVEQERALFRVIDFVGEIAAPITPPSTDADIDTPVRITVAAAADTVEAYGATRAQAARMRDDLADGLIAPGVDLHSLPPLPMDAELVASHPALRRYSVDALRRAPEQLRDLIGAEDDPPLLWDVGGGGASPDDLLADGDVDTVVPAGLVDIELSEWLRSPAPEGPHAEARTLAELWLRSEPGDVVRVDEVPNGSQLQSFDDAGLQGLFGPLDLDRPVQPPDAAPADGATEDLPDGLVDQLDRLEAIDPLFGDPNTAEPDAADAARARFGSLALGIVQPGRDETEMLAGIAALEVAIDEVVDGVTFTGAGTLNLTSRDGTLPVAIVNDNPFPVTVELTASAERLRFPAMEGDRTLIRTFAPGETRLDLDVEALATGSVPVDVAVRVPDGGPILDERRLQVRSTEVSGVGIVLSVGALAILGVWWFRTWRNGNEDSS